MKMNKYQSISCMTLLALSLSCCNGGAAKVVSNGPVVYNLLPYYELII
jgi:hypothetical protein